MAKKKNPPEHPAVEIVDFSDYPLPLAKQPVGLKPKDCRWRVDPTKLGFKTTETVKPLASIVGQPRASSALQLGAEIRGHGYNVFVTGLSATGRSTALKTIFEGFKLRMAPGKDHCYVNNFQSPDQPRLIVLPRGQGKKFRQEMAKLVNTLRRTIPHALEDETVLDRKRDVAEKYANKEASLFKELEKKVSKDGFALVQVQMGPYTRPDVFPLIDGEPVPPNQVGKKVEEGKFPADKIENLYKRYQGHKSELRAVLKQVRQLNREMTDKTEAIEKDVLGEIMKDYCQDFVEAFPQKNIEEYLCEVRDFIIAHPEIFSTEESDPQQNVAPSGAAALLSQIEDIRQQDPFRLFQVNVIHDSTQEGKSPIVVEHHPNYHNLFGTIEREMRIGGYWTSDFTQIRGGSLLRADGGYLILNAMDVLQETLSWRTLLRTLKTGKLQVQGLDTLLSIAPATLKPEPIDIDVTVILIGDSYLYHLLSYYEEDFARVFKVRADFDSLMPRGKKQIGYYAALGSKMARNENTLHMDAGAVARLAEEGARSGGSGGKMSAQLGEIADIIREASHHAITNGRKLIRKLDIEHSIKDMEYRQDLIRERIEEAIKDDILIVETRGSQIGQINGLAVHMMGSFAFGRPQRITCEISMGDEGVVNIEREAKLSGRIHDKGVLILEGFLRHMYGMDGPISLSASLCFEQSYGQVDGDSASLAEALVLLSEISGIPLRQDLAVTGSINQKGQVQAIGGINDKIEGFFRICSQQGLTGTNGVVMPKSNVSELMLSDEVVAAMAAGKFSVIPVSSVNQALEIFTGIKAGRKLKKGGFSVGSIHDRVDITLADFYWAAKSPAEREEGTEESKPTKRRRQPRKLSD